MWISLALSLAFFYVCVRVSACVKEEVSGFSQQGNVRNFSRCLGSSEVSLVQTQKAPLSPAGDAFSELCGPRAHLLLIIGLKYKTTHMTSNLSGERRKKEMHQPTEQNTIQELEFHLIVL